MADEDGGSPLRHDPDTASHFHPNAQAPNFAPAQPTDARVVGEWQSRYSATPAAKRIRAEAAYVLVVITACALTLLALALDWPRPQTGLTRQEWSRLVPYAVAVAGGGLGGALFTTKWLYHSVARGIWHVDRWLWRVFTPALGAGAALTVIALSASRAIPLFGTDIVHTKAGALGVSLLIGYVSDRAFSRLERLAEDHLGSTRGTAARSGTSDAKADPEGSDDQQ